MRPAANRATGRLLGSRARTLAFFGSAVVAVFGLGTTVTYGNLDEVVVLLALLPLGVAFTLRSPRGTILALAVWLAVLGTTRRLFPTTSSSTLGNALLLAGPIVLLLLFVTSVEKGSLTDRSALAKPVYWLTALAAIEIINPLQGSLAVGIGGGLFLVAPMLAFWIGRSLLNDQAIRRLLGIVAWLAIAAAGYGLAQTYDGFPSWDNRWIQTKGYAALNVGHTIRAFSSFASAQEYAIFVAIGIAIWFARARTPASALLAVSAVSFLGVALFLESSRSTLVYAAVAIGIMLAARAGVSLLGAAVGGGLALVVLLLIVDHVSGGGSAIGANANATGQLVGHQVSGLAHPFDSKTSTLDGHFSRLLQGLGEAFTMPIGHGTGSVTNAAGVFGTTSQGTELDPSNAAVALGLPGLILYLVVLVRGLSTAFRVASVRRDWISVAVLGMLVVTVMQWLNGSLYSTVSLPWLCLGWTDRVDTETLTITDADAPRTMLAGLGPFTLLEAPPPSMVLPLPADDIVVSAERSVQSATRAAVLVTCLNDASGLEMTLVALNQQSIRLELRVIVVDNGSIDRSSRVANALADLVISEPRTGAGFAHNTGLAAVDEPYVLCLDAGVRPVNPDWAESYVAALDYLPQQVIGVTGPVVSESVEDRWARRPEMTPGAERDKGGNLLYAYGGNNALRVEAVRAIGFFNEEGADDAGLGIRARRAGLSYAWVDGAAVLHKNRPGIFGYWNHMRESGALSAELRPTPNHTAAVLLCRLTRALWFGGASLIRGDSHEATAGFVRCTAEAVGAVAVWRRRRSGDSTHSVTTGL